MIACWQLCEVLGRHEVRVKAVRRLGFWFCLRLHLRFWFRVWFQLRFGDYVFFRYWAEICWALRFWLVGLRY